MKATDKDHDFINLNQQSEKSSNTLNFTEKLEKLRKILAKYNIDWYMVPSFDEYGSDYSPIYLKRLQYITGFSGSFGIAILGKDNGYLITDSRYVIQARHELDPSYFQVIKLDSDLKKIFHNITEVGFDPKLFTRNRLKTFQSLKLKKIENNLIDEIWDNRPKSSSKMFYEYDIKYTGLSAEDKIVKICQHLMDSLRSKNDTYFICTDVPFICWLLNIRGFDLKNSPLVLSHLIIKKAADYTLTLYLENFPEDQNDLKLGKFILKLAPIRRFILDIQQIKQSTVLIDPNNTAISVLDHIDKSGMKIPSAMGDIAEVSNKIIQFDLMELKLWPSCKNEVELENLRKGHENDSVSLIEFFAWLSDKIKKEDFISEYELGKKLQEFRNLQPGYVCESFDPICGYKENGAIVHYRAKENQDKVIKDEILLIDSGGQYYGCTTDVTRTIALKATDIQKKLYTCVLMGHIDLASTILPEKSFFSQLDSIARRPIWSVFHDYAHGSGHGIGSFSSVHEMPISIRPFNNVSIAPGMVFSNEPGVYIENEFGIRIENDIYVNQPVNGFLSFSNLTLVPYCNELINVELLSDSHKKYLKEYYKTIEIKLKNRLSDLAKSWLEEEFKLLDRI